MGAGVLATLPFQFSKVVLSLSKLPSTQKSGPLATKLGVNVDLHSIVSDLSFQNKKFIAEMTVILLLQRFFYEMYSALIDYFVCNM